MRYRIAILAFVSFAVAGIFGAYAPVASAYTQGMAYGTCYISAEPPVVTANGPAGQARISCGTTSGFSDFKVMTGVDQGPVRGSWWDTKTYSSLTVSGVVKKNGPVEDNQMGTYRTKVTFYGYVLVGPQYCLALNNVLYPGAC